LNEPQAEPKRSTGRLRRKGGHPAAAPPAAPEAAAGALPDPPARAQALQRAFLIALVLGAGVAALGLWERAKWFALGGPILVVLLFGLYGGRAQWARHGDLRQRFADASYFLGFLLTMWALLIGFLPAGMGLHPLKSDEILRHFGMALGATAAGLIGRILVLQSATFGESAAAIEADLHAYAARVTDEAGAILAALAAARDSIASEQRQAQERLSAALHSGLTSSLGRFEAALGPMEERFAQAASSVTLLSHSFAEAASQGAERISAAAAAQEGAFARLAEASTSLAQSVARLDSDIEAVRGSATAAMEQAGGKLHELARSLASNATGQDRVAQALAAMEADTARLRAALVRVEADVAAAGSAVAERRSEADRLGAEAEEQLRRERSALAERLGQEREALANIVQAERGRLSQDIDLALGQLAGIIDGFARQLSELRAGDESG
jgi:hypothetical protein